MILFLDTEYTNPEDRCLISLAMVSEDGKREFYLETTDFPLGKCNSFVVSNVLPHLGKHPAHLASCEEINKPIAEWFNTLPRSINIACDSFLDKEFLLQGLGDIPLKNLNGWLDLRPMIDTGVYHATVKKFHTEQRPWHHALYDAQAHRAGWMAWMNENNQRS